MSETLLPPEESPLAGQPLAARMRPASLDEIVGQQHLLGPGKVLRRLISSDVISSMIFWGPPGVGKTTLARVIALQTQATFIDFSAVTSGIKEIRQVMLKAEENRTYGVRTIVFVDEIHRFNKAQQDAFLPFVEKGSIVLIGATTENPSFEVNSALLSRCKVFVLQALTKADILTLLRRALPWRMSAVSAVTAFPSATRRWSPSPISATATPAAPSARSRWWCSTGTSGKTGLTYRTRSSPSASAGRT